ncbi:MAG: TetR/AcrR family transcriptional regulator, partial [Actinomycetota bacterium]
MSAELFARHGYRATTLDDVAGALGVKKASLYHYIGSKEELLTEIYDRILERITSTVAPIASTKLPADERLRRMVHAHVGVVASERDMLAVLFREEAELSEPFRRAIRRRKRDYERIFEGVVEEGERLHLLRPVGPRLT